MEKRRWRLASFVLAGLLITGCRTPSVKDSDQPTGKFEAKPADQVSCVERSAQTRLPHHSLVELVRCIAQTDDLHDPDHLFHKTLGIKNDRRYGESKNVPWGISVGAGGRLSMDEIRHLPKGILVFQYTRIDAEINSIVGKRYLGFGVNPEISCVKLEEVISSLGKEFLLAPARIVTPTPDLSPKDLTLAARNVSGIFYISPRFFVGDENGRIDFDFDHRECVTQVSVQRNLVPPTYRQQERKK